MFSSTDRYTSSGSHTRRTLNDGAHISSLPSVDFYVSFLCVGSTYILLNGDTILKSLYSLYTMRQMLEEASICEQIRIQKR